MPTDENCGLREVRNASSPWMDARRLLAAGVVADGSDHAEGIGKRRQGPFDATSKTCWPIESIRLFISMIPLPCILRSGFIVDLEHGDSSHQQKSTLASNEVTRYLDPISILFLVKHA
jgi:hypothetical protein